MEPSKEFYFLTELRFLTGTALWHAERIRELVSEWTSVQQELTAPQPKNRARFNLVRPDDFFEALVEEEIQRTRLRQQQFDRSLNAQWELFARVDAFLAIYGRIALILFPQKEARDAIQKERGDQLREVLEITTEHQISHKVLRNKWIHFDEVIDALPPGDIDPITLQRFVHSREVEHYRDTTLRLMVIDALTVIYRGFGVFRLEEMFEAVGDIQTRAFRGIETWGKRNVGP